MSSSGDFSNPLRKFKLVFLGEQSGKDLFVIYFGEFIFCSVEKKNRNNTQKFDFIVYKIFQLPNFLDLIKIVVILNCQRVQRNANKFKEMY